MKTKAEIDAMIERMAELTPAELQEVQNYYRALAMAHEMVQAQQSAAAGVPMVQAVYPGR